MPGGTTSTVSSTGVGPQQAQPPGQGSEDDEGHGQVGDPALQVAAGPLLEAPALLANIGGQRKGNVQDHGQADGANDQRLRQRLDGRQRKKQSAGRGDSHDRRVTRVALTPKGQRFVARSRTRRDAYLASHLRSLTPSELATLDNAARILERVIEGAE